MFFVVHSALSSSNQGSTLVSSFSFGSNIVKVRPFLAFSLLTMNLGEVQVLSCFRFCALSETSAFEVCFFLRELKQVFSEIGPKSPNTSFLPQN